MAMASRTHLENAMIMARRAIEAREKINQGKEDARLDAAMRGTDPIDEVQKWMTSKICASLIADNQWNMAQANMYSQLVQAEEALRHTAILTRIENMLTAIDRDVTDVHDSVKEMKVY
jgi:hypothetical protein